MDWPAAAGLALMTALGGGPVLAGTAGKVYTYHIEHPRYGDIGTYTNVVTRSGDISRSLLRFISWSSLLGIVMYREDANRTEHWQGDRLVAFTESHRYQRHQDRAPRRGRGTTSYSPRPRGRSRCRGGCIPRIPGRPEVLHTDLMMSTKNGRVGKVRVSGGNFVSAKFDGKDLWLRRFEIDGEKQQFVWVNDRDVAVAFQTVEDGSPIDFVLNDPPQNAAEAEAQQRADRN